MTDRSNNQTPRFDCDAVTGTARTLNGKRQVFAIDHATQSLEVVVTLQFLEAQHAGQSCAGPPTQFPSMARAVFPL